MNIVLTKSDFLRFLQCPKQLWLHKNKPEIKPDLSITEEAIFEQGYEVEVLANQLFSENAQFQVEVSVEGLYAKADVLELDGSTGKWNLYEVKSSNKVKKEHISDLAFQKYVFEKSGKEIQDCFVVHLNGDYVRKGDIDVQSLFTITNVTDKVEDYLHELPNLIETAKQILELKEEPKVRVGSQCKNPYVCPFMEYCWKDIPKHTVFDLPHFHGRKRDQLLNQDTLMVQDIPDDFPLTDKQWAHARVMQNGKAHIDQPKIVEALNELEFPLYFLDYESCNPAIPLFDGISPAQQLCFQYSLHILEEDGETLHHKEFLHTGKDTPLPHLLKQMREDIGPKGSVIVWFKPFETGRNKEMAKLYLEYADFLNDINERTFDLMDVFKNGHFIHPDFRGSSSIKKVLPVLAPDFSHSELEIRDGGTASVTWFRAVHKDEHAVTMQEVQEALLEYCKLDTLAMVKIFKHLQVLPLKNIN